MGKNGGVDYSGLEELKKRLESYDYEKFIESCAKEIASRLLRKVIKRTPVGVYPLESGKKGGTLRRGWTKTNDIQVQHVGDSYVINITNPVEYASYVEYGHRTRNHEGWVKGQFMMTISEREIERDSPKILENKIKKELGELFK